VLTTLIQDDTIKRPFVSAPTAVPRGSFELEVGEGSTTFALIDSLSVITSTARLSTLERGVCRYSIFNEQGVKD
jgi:hypothetical protein